MMFATRVFTGPAWLTSPQNNWIRVIARAKEHVSLTQAQAGMTATFRQFNRDIVLPLVTNERARQSVSAPIAVLAAVAAVATWLPARRASQVDLLIALRSE
jgi:hypothetical protein